MEFGEAVPVKVGVVSLVRLSELEPPVSLPGARSGVDGDCNCKTPKFQALNCDVSTLSCTSPSASVALAATHGSGLAAPEASAQAGTCAPLRKTWIVSWFWPAGTSKESSRNTALKGFAAVAAAEGQAERAARLLGRATALWESHRLIIWPAERAECERTTARARVGLDEAAWQRARDEGRALALEHAVAYALEEPADA